MQEIPSTHCVKINDIDLYYEKYLHSQSKNTIVLLHGFLSSSFSFRKLVPLLIKDFNLILIDLPPFGKSGKARNYRYSYESVSKTVLQLLEKMGDQNIYAAGHSMGGQIVLNMLNQRPGFIKKGILLSSSGYLPRSKKHLVLSSYLPFFHRFVKYHLGKTGVIGNLNHVVYDKAIIDEEMINGYSAPFDDPYIFRALTKMIRHREGDLDSKVLLSIDTPCLLLWGEHDRVVPPDIGKRLANDLPNSKLVILSGAGHLIPEEKPKEVFEEIQNFIQSDLCFS
ncbi:alpha/beta fold hydrolase [Lederbergia citrea]|uniref:alpha/beta fold hydrolase n=1 Tax=Lederbergia citrea TaxID=2833581 RepID=UPI001BC8E6A0|nr:alpha/beta hydrolase [Lederbergia citrea]MBS4178584.1 alpha/beta hydrolase [Lederbergia citrea]